MLRWVPFSDGISHHTPFTLPIQPCNLPWPLIYVSLPVNPSHSPLLFLGTWNNHNLQWYQCLLTSHSTLSPRRPSAWSVLVSTWASSASERLWIAQFVEAHIVRGSRQVGEQGGPEDSDSRGKGSKTWRWGERPAGYPPHHSGGLVPLLKVLWLLFIWGLPLTPTWLSLRLFKLKNCGHLGTRRL